MGWTATCSVSGLRWGRAGCAGCVALVLATAPFPAAAGSPPVQRPRQLEEPLGGPSPREPPPPAAVVAPEPTQAPVRIDPEVERLHAALRRGDRAIAEGNYEDAVHFWGVALRSTQPLASTRVQRTALVHRLVNVEVTMFRESGSPQHLVDADDLLRARMIEYEDHHARDAAAQEEWAELAVRRTELRDHMASVEGTRDYARWYNLLLREELRADRELKRRYRAGKGMAIAGGPLMVVGGNLTYVGATLGEVPRAFFPIGIVMLLVGAAFIPTGAVMYVRAKREARSRVDQRLYGYFQPTPGQAPPSDSAFEAPPTVWIGAPALRF